MIAQKERELADLHTTISQSKYRNDGTYSAPTMNFTVNETTHSPSAKIEIKQETSPVTTGYDVQHHKRNNSRTLDDANRSKNAELEEFKNFEAIVLSGEEETLHDEEQFRAEGPTSSPKKTKNEVVTKVVDLAE